jgi:diguanylate cyclase (GGDEF)-like protein/PAS domain S-box-containing protein
MRKEVSSDELTSPHGHKNIPLLRSSQNENILSSLMAIDDHTLITMASATGEFLYANKKFCDLTQFTEEELVGTGHVHLFFCQQNKELIKEIDRTLMGGQSWHGEIMGTAKDGSNFWLATTIIPIHYPHTNETQFFTISNDVSSFKQVELESEQRLFNLEQAVESISDSFILYDADDRLVYCNGKHLEFFPHLKKYYVPGVHRMEIWEKHVATLREKSDDPNLEDYINKRVNTLGSNNYDIENQLLDGRWVALRQRKLANGGLVAIRTDITKMKKMMTDLETKSAEAISMAAALRDVRDVHEDAMDNITDGFALWDQNGRLVNCNAVTKNIFASLGDIFHPGLKYSDFIFRALEVGLLSRKHSVDQNELHWRAERHLSASGSFEEQYSDGRWVRVTQTKASQGRIVAIIADITKQKQTETAIKMLAETDSLTGLANRTLFSQCIQTSMIAADSTDSSMAILLLDLDHFKMINDTMGHPVGDALLCEVARRLKNCTNKFDTVARLGGDEFAVIANGIHSKHDIRELAENITRSLSKPYDLDGLKVFSTASIGITMYPSDDTDADNLLRNADIALYKAKESGRGQYKLFDLPMNQEIHVRRTIEQGLRAVLKRNELQLYYQPQINVITGKIIGAEALVRWITPDGYEVPPMEFIPVAEETGLIEPLCQFALTKACNDAVRWRRQGLGDITAAVNISAVQFKHQDLPDMIREALVTSGLPPSLLELEITEGVAIDQSSTEIFEQVKDLGIKTAIDDFGTGYSSLSQLTNFPVNRLKIDKSFIREQENMAVCSAIINLGKSLNLSVIAEGVETMDELESLLTLGCSEMQGFLFARALPEEDFFEFVRSHNPDQHKYNSKLNNDTDQPLLLTG